MKEAGIGLAVAALIDATIVRPVLLPAAMKPLDDWNLYLPRWLSCSAARQCSSIIVGSRNHRDTGCPEPES